MNIAIVGYGAEGKSNYDYFSALGHDCVIVDERPNIVELPSGSQTMLGPQAFDNLDKFEMIVRTPGVALDKLAVSPEKLWSSTNEFFKQCKTPIIGVTGSKGKGTTCSLIASILRDSGKTVELVGNIGRPALDVLAESNEADVVVYELSSFQLWDLRYSPQTAVVLHIEPDHLDVHSSMDDYLSAKANIGRYQPLDGQMYYHPTNPDSRWIAQQSEAVKQRYASKEDQVAYVEDGYFYRRGELVCAIDHLKLPGAHNLDNACAAIAATSSYGVTPDDIARGLAGFTGLDHRLKFVRELGGVRYYDDSIATTPGSAIAALRSFVRPKILILGGSSKGADYSEVIEVAKTSNVKKLILIGQESEKLEPLAKRSGLSYVRLSMDVTMKDIVGQAHDAAETGDIVILSPAAASFDMFSSYSDRGDQFISAVNEL